MPTEDWRMLRLRNAAIALLCVALFATPALSQVPPGSGVSAVPPITPGHCVKWSSPWAIQDAGAACGTGSGPGGSSTQVQYNNAGAFGGVSGATTNGTTLSLSGGTAVGLTQLILNGTTAQQLGNTVRNFALLGTTTDTSSFSVARWSADANGPALVSYKSRGATIGTLGAVSNADVIASFNGIGDDGNTLGGLTVAQVRLLASCSFTAGSGCGAFVVQTRNLTGALTERFRIDETGQGLVANGGIKIFDQSGNLFSAGNTVATSANNLSFFSATTSAQLAGIISDETGSGSLVFANTPTLVTPVLGAATGTSIVLSGNISAAALAPTASTCSGTNFILSATNTLGGCINSVVGVEWAPGGEKIHVNGTASNSPLLLDGTIFAGGTTTTNFPTFLIQPTGTTAVTTWSTAGTGIGMNMPSGFTGNFLDFHVNGAASVFSVSSNGTVVATGAVQSGSDVIAGLTSYLRFNGRTRLASPADGQLTLTNSAINDFSRLQFGGTTSSFPAIKRSGAAVAFRLADDSADASITAAGITFSGGLKSAGGAVTLTGTGSPTCDTASCTDDSGTVVSGTTATSIVITFSTPKPNKPTCNVSPQTQLVAFSYTTSTTAITITQTATSGEKVDYVCLQH